MLRLYWRLANTLDNIHNPESGAGRIRVAKLTLPKLIKSLALGDGFAANPEVSILPRVSPVEAFQISGFYTPEGSEFTINFSLEVFAVLSLLDPWDLEFIDCDSTDEGAREHILESFREELHQEIPL